MSKRRKQPTLKPHRIPLLDRDPSPVAVLEATHIIKPFDAPEHCVFCFFPDVLDDLASSGAREISSRISEMGKQAVYEIESYHYLPPSLEVKPHPRAVRAIRDTLKNAGLNFIAGRTWTTDGLYRETRAKVNLRRRQGCVVVEMEAAAFFAVAKFRRAIFGQILYGADDLGGDDWDHRSWTRHEIRRLLFDLTAEACLQL